MTAIQVDDKVGDIMRLPCVKECHKEKNGRYTYHLWNGLKAEDGSWIFNAESETGAVVLSEESYKIIRSAIYEQDRH